MPKYDYICKDCGKDFTVTKSMTDTSTPVCPHCNSSNVGKVWGGFSLKGCCGDSGSSSGGSCGSCSGGSCSTCH